VSVLALSRALGHHSAAFTLSRYVHVLEGDEAPPLELATPPKSWSTDAHSAPGLPIEQPIHVPN